MPLLIVAEDIHWADDLSLEFLLVLARATISRQVAMLITLRSDEPHPALRTFLAGIECERLGIELRLTRFATNETAHMIALLFQQRQVREEFVAAIQAHTDGNPFFIEETLRSLAATGDIYRERGVWTRKPLDILRIPRTLDDAVQRRLGHLSSAAREMLATAAVLGRRFDFDVLQRLTGHPERVLLNLLKEAVASHLVQEVDPQHAGEDIIFEFHHALTQRAISSELLLRERRMIHSQAVDAIEIVHAAALERHVTDLALHAFEAGKWKKAHVYASRAGEQAVALLAPRTAVQQYTRAIDAIGLDGTLASFDWEPSRIELLRRRAGAYHTKSG